MKKFSLILLIVSNFCLANAQTARYFEFTTNCGHGNWQDTSFIASTSDQTIIDSVLANLARPIQQRMFINGPIDYGNGGINHNASHWFSWHFIPNQWSLTDFAIEVCDGCPYTDLDSDTAYWVGLIGHYCPWSGIPVREVDEPVGIDKQILGNKILFYPNPAKDKIFFNDVRGVEVTLSNPIGQIIQRIPNPEPNQSIDITRLEAGIYFLHFMKGDDSVSKKLIIQ